jgi:ubiquinone/menaquinone biosynthesis C-methylase UbiE
MNKSFISQICPPLIWNRLAPWFLRVRRKGDDSSVHTWFKNDPGIKGNAQDCDIYWDEDFAKVLESWGEGNAWREIEMFMVGREGMVLDIACGTGKVIEILSRLPGLTFYGCDISDLLIQKALDRGIAAERLKVCDATETGYSDDVFDYAYSIGSLEHFTEEGIFKAIRECRRIVKKVAFHQIPVSRSGENEGWIKPLQSYYNNSAAWWLEKFSTTYREVYVLDSAWQDSISVGKWFVCR